MEVNKTFENNYGQNEEKLGGNVMNNSLFSVIVLHYNQPRYVLTALDSVLSQNYSNIEIVFADDASTSIELEEIKKYIEENKGSNIKNVVYSINEENIGTVETVNRAVKNCSGEHILFFAADDALCNASVISNFKRAFDKADEDVYMISSQCYMMDIDLEEKIENFVKPTSAASFNKLSAIEQYKVFCKSCFLAIGATAMRRDMFDKFGFFNEEYKFVEDWSYFLHLTRNGGIIRYVDFEGLLHRDGGVSHFTAEGELPPHVLAYKYDMVKIFEIEILPYLKQFEPRIIERTLNWYASEKKGYELAGGKQKTKSIMELVLMFPSFYIQSALLPITRDWQWMMRMVRAAAYIALVYIGCLVACLTTSEGVVGTIFSIAYLCFGIALLVAVYCAFGIVLIKLGLTVLRNIKKILRRIK